MQNLVIDGVEYRVRIVYGSLTRSFSILEGPNSGTALTGKAIRDIVGTTYNYSLQVEPDYRFPDDYDDLYEVISSPVESHSIELPYGQSTLLFDAMITGGEDTLGPTLAGVKRWNGLTINFTALEPQRGA